jgi:hypothetical protein
MSIERIDPSTLDDEQFIKDNFKELSESMEEEPDDENQSRQSSNSSLHSESDKGNKNRATENTSSRDTKLRATDKSNNSQ